MISVALIGPDGAGKTTIGRQIKDALPAPVKYLYMGVNTDSSNVALPSTRMIHALKRVAGAKPDNAGPPDPVQKRMVPGNRVKRLFYGLKSGVRLANLLVEEGYRFTLSWYYRRRGYIVLFDRDFFSDYYAYDIAHGAQDRPFQRRIHGYFLSCIFPKPDLVIFLDAPGEVLFARKGEGSVAALERRRQDYLQLKSMVQNFVVIDATRPVAEVKTQVCQLIWDFYQEQSKKMVFQP